MNEFKTATNPLELALRDAGFQDLPDYLKASAGGDVPQASEIWEHAFSIFEHEILESMNNLLNDA